MRFLLQGKSNKELGCDLYKLSKNEPHPRTRNRFLGLYHIQKGKTYRQAADSLNVAVSTIQTWVNNFRKFGPDGLSEKGGTGRKPKLSKEQEEGLKELIVEEQKNKVGGRLIAEDIVKLVEKNFKVKYSISGLCHMLHRIGMSWISSRSQHPNADKEKQDTFKKTLKTRLEGSFHHISP